MLLKKPASAFTLAELIVVVTILAVLATIGFLAFQDYSKDAKDSSMQAKVRILSQSVNLESSRNVESARKYAKYDASYVMTGTILSGAVTLAPGAYLSGSTNYSAGPLNFASLRMDGAKHESDGTKYFLAAADVSETLFSGRARNRSFFQVAAQSGSTVYVDGNFGPMAGDVAGLIRNTDPYAPANTPLVSNLGQTPVVYTPVTCNAGETVVGGVCKDPHGASVSFLSHFENSYAHSGASTQITENGFTYSAGKFGSGFSGVGTYARIEDNAAIEFGSSNFTTEIWFKNTDLGGVNRVCMHGYFWNTSAISELCLEIGGVLKWTHTFNGVTGNIATAGGGYNDGNWHFAVIQRSGNTAEMFLDGNSVGTRSISGNIHDQNAHFWIGRAGNISNYDWRGQLDDFRVTKGVARYPTGASFTVPVQPFAHW